MAPSKDTTYYIQRGDHPPAEGGAAKTTNRSSGPARPTCGRAEVEAARNKGRRVQGGRGRKEGGEEMRMEGGEERGG